MMGMVWGAFWIHWLAGIATAPATAEGAEVPCRALCARPAPSLRLWTMQAKAAGGWRICHVIYVRAASSQAKNLAPEIGMSLSSNVRDGGEFHTGRTAKGAGVNRED